MLVPVHGVALRTGSHMFAPDGMILFHVSAVACALALYLKLAFTIPTPHAAPQARYRLPGVLGSRAMFEKASCD